MSEQRMAFARAAEEKAVEYLCRRGYVVLARNYRCRQGEIDIVAMDNDTYVIVEVRARKNWSLGHPLETITPQKQRRLKMATLYFLSECYLNDVPVRFDVISVTGTSSLEIEHLKDAFETQ
jgi:putative endonuclease